MTQRIALEDFALSNPIYASAVVYVYQVDQNLQATTTLAPLYAGPAGSAMALNPQQLDSRGKFPKPVYVDRPVVMQVSIPGQAVTSTGVASLWPRWRGTWAVGTLYYPGERMQSPIDETAYTALVAHVAADLAADLAAGRVEREMNITSGAPINSPAFTGSPTAPTPPATSNDTRIANTAWIRSRGSIFVQDYGAVGDGTTDDTAAVRSAIAAAAALSGVSYGGIAIEFSGKNYRLTDTLSIQNSFVSLRGIAPQGTMLSFAGMASKDWIVFGSLGGAQIRRGGIENLGIFGAGGNTATVAASGAVTGAAVKLVNCYDIRLADLAIENVLCGVDIGESTNNIQIVRSVIIPNQSGSLYGVNWHCPGDGSYRSDVLSFLSVTIEGQWSNAIGFNWRGYCNTAVGNGLRILHLAKGIVVSNSAASASYFPSFLNISDLELEGFKTRAIEINGGTDFKIGNSDINNLSGGDASQGNADDHAILVTADAAASITRGLSISNTRIGGCRQNGINYAGRDLQLDGVIFYTTSLATSGGAAAIRLTGTATKAQLSNIIAEEFGGAARSSYGVQIDAGATAVSIAGLDATACVTGAILDSTGTDQVSAIGVFGPGNVPTGLAYSPSRGLAEARAAKATGLVGLSANNTASGANSSARWQLSTGTPNSYVLGQLQDNAGAPYFQEAGGSAVTKKQTDYDRHEFRTRAGTPIVTLAPASAALEYDPDASSNSREIASTAWVKSQGYGTGGSGGSSPSPSSAAPAANGTAAAGTATTYARGDHVHPTDTTRAPLAQPVLTAPVVVTLPTGDVRSEVRGAPGYYRFSRIASIVGGSPLARWDWGALADPEIGGNAGSSWYLSAFADDGSFLRNVALAYRASGVMEFIQPPVAPSPPAAANNAQIVNAAWVKAQGYGTGTLTAAVTSINSATGPALTVSGAGGSTVSTSGNTITVSSASGALTSAVTSLIVGTQTFTGGVTLAAGSNITLTPSGSTVTIAASGGSGSSYTLPAATTGALGGVIAGSGLSISSGGTLSVSGVQSVSGTGTASGITLTTTNTGGATTLALGGAVTSGAVTGALGFTPGTGTIIAVTGTGTAGGLTLSSATSGGATTLTLGGTPNLVSVAGRTGAVTLSVSDVSGAAPLASPSFTGTPTAPTQATTDTSTAIASTAFVKAQGYVTSSGVVSINGQSGAALTIAGAGGSTVSASGSTITISSAAGALTSAVTSLTAGTQTFTGAMTLAAGSGVTLTPSGTTLTIASTGGGGGSYTLPAATTAALGGVIVPGGLVNVLDSSGTIGTQEATITISSGATSVLFTPAAYPWIASATALEVQGYGIDAGTGGDDNVVIVAQLYPVSAPSAPVTSASYYANGTNLYDGAPAYNVQSNAAGTLVGFPVAYPQSDKSNFIATIFTGKNGEPCGFFSRAFAFVSSHFRHYLFAGRRSDSLQVAGVAFTLVGGTGQVIRGGKITVRRVA
ncbi:MAG: Ralstonia phage phiRSL1 [Verrucomicrobiota bacterium]|jgi:hypothetical protein